LAHLDLKVVAAAFFIGRLVSYSVLVAGAGALGDQLLPLFQKQFGSWVAYASAVIAGICSGLGGIVRGRHQRRETMPTASGSMSLARQERGRMHDSRTPFSKPSPRP